MFHVICHVCSVEQMLIFPRCLIGVGMVGPCSSGRKLLRRPEVVVVAVNVNKLHHHKWNMAQVTPLGQENSHLHHIRLVQKLQQHQIELQLPFTASVPNSMRMTRKVLTFQIVIAWHLRWNAITFNKLMGKISISKGLFPYRSQDVGRLAGRGTRKSKY